MKNQIHSLLVLILTGFVTFSCEKEDPNVPEACFVASKERVAGIPINFSTSCTIYASSYHWDFGDGESSDEAYPSHTFTTSGDYAVILTVTNANGNSDDVTHVMVVEEPV